MRIEIWSDIVCPFCYVGKHELEKAIARFENGPKVEVVYRSFELHPDAGQSRNANEELAEKYQLSADQVAAQQDAVAQRAAGLGLEYNWQAAVSANTFDAHRLIKLAASVSNEKAVDAEERLMKAAFSEGKDVADHDVLATLAEEIELNPVRVQEVLASDEFGDQVRADQAEAQQFGITGVPFFVFEGEWAVSGAQPASVFDAALEQVANEIANRSTPQFLTLGGETQTGSSCGCGGCGCGAN